MNLLIVESPNKIKKLVDILGSGWEVVSTSGHIEDFPRGGIGINIEDFSMRFEMKHDYQHIIQNIQNKAAKAEEIYIATDPDREGESIANSLMKILPDNKPIKRVSFNSITSKAVKTAIHEPRGINENLVKAAHSRKAIDRLIGYILSPLATDALNTGALQREKTYYAVGRVISPTLALVDEQTDIVRAYVPKESYQLNVTYDVFGSLGAASIWIKGRSQSRFNDEKIARAAAASIAGKHHKVVSVTKTRIKHSPAKPLVTATALQAAYKKHGFPAGRTMNTLQKCFSSGALTYHRTDSPNISPEAVAMAKDFITSKWGNYYFVPRKFDADEAHAQEAHECIRPTTSLEIPEWMFGDWEKIYKLSRDYMVASLMADAIIEETKYVIDADGQTFEATGQKMIFDGFYKMMGVPELRELPEIKKGTIISRCTVEPKKVASKSPELLNDATIIGGMVENGFGRPGTRARAIEDLRERGYMSLRSELHDGNNTDGPPASRYDNLGERPRAPKDGFETTEKGKKLLKYLYDNHPWVVDKQFTSEMEGMLDEVAKGKIDHRTPIKRVWEKMQETVPALQGFAPQMSGR